MIMGLTCYKDIAALSVNPRRAQCKTVDMAAVVLEL